MLLIAHPLLRRVYESFLSRSNRRPSSKDTASSSAVGADARFEGRVRFDLYFALVFIAALHGISALKILLILYINYQIAKRLPRSYIPAATWAFNISILFANELCGGYPFEKMAALLAPSMHGTGKESRLVLWGRGLDKIGGLMPRWEILFSITVLRLISFNMDYYWRLDYPIVNAVEV